MKKRTRGMELKARLLRPQNIGASNVTQGSKVRQNVRYNSSDRNTEKPNNTLQYSLFGFCLNRLSYFSFA